ncbi:LysR substrate-binding domain-containing protein [uncultured Roseobacter sp.]|uniref:LysR family transcriptional regulator n=1 Tax=uncultured Roseobacter sp. TaxID=114847 RepID=UPI00260E3C53|nr:LysR substrate-binding domain-containing protein [uncultured Roseobacter sp.]
MEMQTGLRRLRYFRMVAETLNFRRAARELNITQPALSRAITQLENELGVRLFERSNARVSLTHAGHTFSSGCDRVFTALSHATEETQRVARGEIGSLAIGYTDTAIAGTIPDIIETFRHALPTVAIRLYQVHTQAQMQMLRSGQLDIGLMTGPVDRSALSAITVQRDRLVVLAPKMHRLAARDSLRLKELANEPFVLGDPNDWFVFNRSLLQLCERAGFAPRVIQTAPETQAIIGLVRCGLGLTIMPECHAQVLNARVVAIPLGDDIAPMLTQAAWIEGRDHPALTRFCDHLRHYDLEGDGGRAQPPP